MSENLSSKIQNKVKEASPSSKTGLPDSYGGTKIVLLVRDPLWFYAYWNIAPEKINELSKKYGDNFDRSQIVLRVYDVTDVSFNGSNANRYFDVRLDGLATSWYVNVGEFDRVWCVDIGYILKNGEFVLAARSNPAKMPAHGISNVHDDQWASMEIEFEKLLRISGKDIGHSSADIVSIMRRRWEELTKMPSSGYLPSSSSSSRLSKPEKAKTKKKDKQFWLRADTEIVVYGATEPDAKLKVSGKTVKLKEDGSFSLRFYLPDGKSDYEITAESKDSLMKKKISFHISKETK